MALLKGLEAAGGLASLQPNSTASEAVIAQTGADDPAIVRLAVNENCKLPPAAIAELAVRYEAGASIQSLGKAFGLHHQTVRAHLVRQGITIRPLRSFSGGQEAEVARLYRDEQWTMIELATRFGVSETAIRKALIRQGVERRVAARRPTARGRAR